MDQIGLAFENASTGYTTLVRMRRDTSMGNAMRVCAQRESVNPDVYLFTAPDGTILTGLETPRELGLKDGDIIITFY
jgi:hypothetical protein